MLKLDCTYFIVKDMENSIEFYSALLEMEPTHQNSNRWVQFDFHGKSIALWHPEFDTEKMNSNDNLEDCYSDSYIKYHRNTEIIYGNNIVLNFYVEDLNIEYERVMNLDIGEMTEIMTINFNSPYHMFILNDPDGNQIEITGNI